MTERSLRTAWTRVLGHHRLATLILVLATIPLFMLGHHLDPSTPRPGAPGWWGWIDQARYLEAARAWAALSLDPARHWYFPGYPLIGAPFAALTPNDPFYVPDLLCLVASAWLFASVGERLAPHLPGIRPIAALVFLLQLTLSRLMLRSFIEPWTSTPTVPLVFATLLLAFRFQARPAPLPAALLGLAATASLLFRPTDALALAAVTACFAAGCLLVAMPGWRHAAAIAVSGVLGAALPVLLALTLHAAIHGWSLGGYLLESRAVGFEWRLLPLRWVILVAASDPLLAGQTSLSQAFVWIIPGLAGIAACLSVIRGRLLGRHVLTSAAILAHIALYLTYRDLEPQGLIRFGNHHYFTWAILLLGLYSVLVVLVVWPVRRAVPAWGVGVATVFALFSWRAGWTPVPGYTVPPRIQAPATLVLEGGLHSLFDAILVRARGDFASIYLAPHTMLAGSRIWRANIDFKAWPVEGGFILMLRRRLLDETLTLSLQPPAVLDAGVPPSLYRAGIVFDLPWWMRPAPHDPARQ